MNEAIDGREGHGLIREDFAPFAERLIGSDEHRSSFVAGADQLEQNAGLRLTNYPCWLSSLCNYLLTPTRARIAG